MITIRIPECNQTYIHLDDLNIWLMKETNGDARIRCQDISNGKEHNWAPTKDSKLHLNATERIAFSKLYKENNEQELSKLVRSIVYSKARQDDLPL